ncbi:MAG: tail fiber domain-containing protein [Bacteroidota bacterium]|nr:tail fiber domain-containing protein [Bacteroidota bacterium]MDP3145263.1 tail fiber domain-containing protein [Bacteroidota bacterium]
MKTPNLKLLGAAVFLSVTISSFSQNNWTINGNGNTTGATNFLGTTNNEPLNIKTNGTQRMFINDGTGNSPFPTTPANNIGYISIGNPPASAPLFNISVLTASVGNTSTTGGGDFLIGGTTNKSPSSLMGLIDGSASPGIFSPCYIGSLDNVQQGPSITTIGNINGAQDNGPGINNFAVHQFVVGKGFSPYGSGIGGISEINNRVAFVWKNASIIKMMMNAAGRLRIGAALTIPGALPNNRIEITSSAGATPALNDPYFGTINGSSGLRFTNLTSTNTPIANGVNGVTNTKVLTVDQNGDIVLANGAGAVPTTNNGIVVNTGVIQLGSDCANTSAVQKSAQGLQNNRFLHLNGQNFIFGDGGRVGIGMPPSNGNAQCNSVGNKLEIQSTVGNPYFNTVNGASGLRFRLLTSANAPVVNGVNGVNTNLALSVDQNGDVVLITPVGLQGPVGPQGPPGAGGGITTAQNGLNLFNSSTVELGGTLLHPTTVNLSTHSFNFLGSSTTLSSGWKILDNGPVQHFAYGPAYNYGYSLSTKDLDVGYLVNANNTAIGGNLEGYRAECLANSAQVTGYSAVINNQALNGNAYGFLSNVTSGGKYKRGFSAICQGTSDESIGIFSEVRGAKQNYGGKFVVDNNGDPTVQDLYGVHTQIAFNAGGNNMNVGIYSAVATAVTNPNNPPANGPYFYAGYFSGSVYVSGQIGPSDQKLKQNIDTINNALNIIKQLKPKTFDYKLSQFSQMNLPSGLQYGLIAQDVEPILPELVSNNIHPEEKDSNGVVIKPAVTFKGLEYQQIIPILIRAVQQLEAKSQKQDSIINLQNNLLTALTQSINNCCSNTSIRTTGIIGKQTNVELSDKDIIVLNQNSPNPFAESTIITYNIPIDFKVAQIIFNTTDGRIIKAVDIKEKGKGELNVYANDLTNGLYSYYLVIDGKVIDTKKLIKQN